MPIDVTYIGILNLPKSKLYFLPNNIHNSIEKSYVPIASFPYSKGIKMYLKLKGVNYIKVIRMITLELITTIFYFGRYRILFLR